MRAFLAILLLFCTACEKEFEDHDLVKDNYCEDTRHYDLESDRCVCKKGFIENSEGRCICDTSKGFEQSEFGDYCNCPSRYVEKNGECVPFF